MRLTAEQKYDRKHAVGCPGIERDCVMTVTRCFTFGFAHQHPNGFVRITAPTYEKCRAEMERRYGNKWSFDYNEEQIADQLKRFPQMYEVRG